MPQLYNDNVGEVLRNYQQDSFAGAQESPNVSGAGVQQIIPGVNIVVDPPIGTGIVTVTATGLQHPSIHFDVPIDAANQNFSNSYLSLYTNALDLNVFRNGLLIPANSISFVNNNTIQIAECLFTGDSIDIAAQSIGGNSTGPNITVTGITVQSNSITQGQATTVNFTGLLTATVTGNTANVNLNPALIPNTRPGAPNSSIQFNNSNSFGGSAQFAYDPGSNTVVLTQSNSQLLLNAAGITFLPGVGDARQYISIATGNISAGNLLTNNILYANGVPYVFYGNTNVAAFLANLGSNNIFTQGNVSANYVLTDNLRYANGANYLITASAAGNTGDFQIRNANGTFGTTVGQFRQVGNSVIINADTLASNLQITRRENNQPNQFYLDGTANRICFLQAPNANANTTTYVTPARDLEWEPGNYYANGYLTGPGAYGQLQIYNGGIQLYRYDYANNRPVPGPLGGGYAGFGWSDSASDDPNDYYREITTASAQSWELYATQDYYANGDPYLPASRFAFRYNVSNSNYQGSVEFNYKNDLSAGNGAILTINDIDYSNPEFGAGIANIEYTRSPQISQAGTPNNTSTSQGWLQFTLGNGAPCWVPWYR